MKSYADDLTCFVASESSFVALDEELQTYQASSGAILNRQKSIELWLGRWSNRQDTPLQIQCGNQQIHILGVRFCPSYYDTVTFSWNAMLQTIRNSLAKWKKRDLSYSSRAKVVSMYAMTKLYYVGHTLSMSLTTTHQFEDLLWGFLWRGSLPLVRREVCIAPSRCRGVRMPHLQNQVAVIHFKTINRLFDDHNLAAWKQLATKELYHFSGQYHMKLAIFAVINWKPRNII